MATSQYGASSCTTPIAAVTVVAGSAVGEGADADVGLLEDLVDVAGVHRPRRQGAHLLHEDRAGLVAGRVPAHPVGDDVDVREHEEAVLVDPAVVAAVRGGTHHDLDETVEGRYRSSGHEPPSPRQRPSHGCSERNSRSWFRDLSQNWDGR